MQFVCYSDDFGLQTVLFLPGPRYYFDETSLIRQVLKPLDLDVTLSSFLEKYPEYRKTLRMAVIHEESVPSYNDYQGWQWSDVETHPTKLIRLVTEGVARISLKTRQATRYLLRDREAVKQALNTIRT